MVGILLDVLRELVLSLYFVDQKVTFHTDKITDLTTVVPVFLAPYLVLVYPPEDDQQGWDVRSRKVADSYSRFAYSIVLVDQQYVSVCGTSHLEFSTRLSRRGCHRLEIRYGTYTWPGWRFLAVESVARSPQ